MAEVAFDHVRKVFQDGTVAVQDLSLEIADGELMVFVGPSGCGKTTALRMVAGLEHVSEGEIRIDSEVVNSLPPRERDVAMVFQNYALYPHKTVFENLAFPLKLRKFSRERSIARWAISRGCSSWRSSSSAGRANSPAGSASAWRWDGPSSASRARS